MTDFNTFLSAAILSDQQNVSYRSLSRGLKCHVNIAKCLLYQYYQEQNARKPGSVYATYLIAGTRIPSAATAVNGQTKEPGEGENGVDVPSSPPTFTSSMLESIQQSQETVKEATPSARVKTVLLVREEDLQSTKTQFLEITGLHIYSLSPGKIPDLVALTDIGRGLFTDVFSKEDPLLHNKTYGVIQNKNVRRRKRRSDLPPPAALIDVPKAAKAQSEKKKEQQQQSNATAATPSIGQAISSLKREETGSRPISRDSTSTREEKKPTSSKPGARDILQAFAKASSKAQSKVKEEPTAAAAATAAQDTPMLDADDDEGLSDDEAIFLDTKTRKSATKRASDVKKEREDKAAKLRKMMDSDDEEPADSNTNKKETSAEGVQEKQEEEKEDADVAWSDSETEKSAAPAAPAAPAGPRRKRGKRKVIKKLHTTDEDGFLVTKEEEVWEQFSETDNDEPKRATAASAAAGASKKNSAATASASASATNSKSKEQGSGGAGQAAPAAKKKIKGDIRGFFGKK